MKSGALRSTVLACFLGFGFRLEGLGFWGFGGVRVLVLRAERGHFL